jgi:hypothetical protein
LAGDSDGPVMDADSRGVHFQSSSDSLLGHGSVGSLDTVFIY